MMSFVAGAVIAATALGGAAPTPHSGDALAAIQQRAAQAIQNRQDAIERVTHRVSENTSLTDAHREQINATLTSTASGLSSLGTTIAADDTAAEAKVDFKLIFTDYRVFAVVVPQSAFVSATDRLTDTAIPRLEKAYAKLEPLAAKDPEAAADVAKMRAALDSATQLTDGLADKFLAVAPSDFDANHMVLKDLRGDLKDAALQVKDAVADAHQAVAELR